MSDPVQALVDAGMRLCDSIKVCEDIPDGRSDEEHEEIIFKQIKNLEKLKTFETVHNPSGWLYSAIQGDYAQVQKKKKHTNPEDNYFVDKNEQQRKQREEIVETLNSGQIEVLDRLCANGMRVRVAHSLICMKSVEHIEKYFENRELKGGDLYTAIRYDHPVFVEAKQEEEPDEDPGFTDEIPF